MDKTVVKAMLSYEYERLSYLAYQEFDELSDMFRLQAKLAYDNSLDDEDRVVLAEICARSSKAAKSLDELHDKLHAAMDLFDETE